MGVMPVGKLIANMALPMVISMLVQALYNVVDSIYVSQVSESAVTALSLAFPIQNLLIGFAVGIGVGVNSLLSKSLGEKNQEAANRAAGNGIVLMAIAMVLFVLFGLFGVRPYFAIQSDNPETVEGGIVYTSICCVFSVGCFASILGERLLQSTGRTVHTMITQSIGAIINIILDPILIHGWFGLPAMGAAGCGVATAILFWFMAASMTFFVRRTDRPALAAEKASAAVLKRIVRIGLPGAFAMLNETAAFALIALIVSPLGVTPVAGHQIAINVSAFVWMCPFSIGSAATIRVGTLLGAGDVEGSKRARLTALTITLIMACVLAVLIYLVRHPVSALYTEDQAVIQMASLLLICEVFYQFPDGVQTNTLCALRGWNDTRAIFCISFIAYWVVSLPLGWVLRMTDWTTEKPLGVLGFWVALIVGLSVAAVLYLLRIHKLEHLSVEAMKKKIGR